jgi:phosphosulfolactate synthase
MKNSITTASLATILSFPNREQKPRQNGLNVIYDPGLPIRMLEQLLAENEQIDAMEMGPGAVFIATDLNERIRICQKNGITPFLGGLVLEKFIEKDKFADYVQFCKDHVIKTFQVSDTRINISHTNKCEIIKELSNHGTVYSRVGSLDGAHIIPPYKWIEMMKAEIEAGSKYVFATGGNEGHVGIYRGSGEVREGLVQEILTQIAVEKIIWDTPSQHQWVYFIETLGSNCNLSLLPPKHVLQVESARIFTHPKTFYLSLESGKR